MCCIHGICIHGTRCECVGKCDFSSCGFCRFVSSTTHALNVFYHRFQIYTGTCGQAKTIRKRQRVDAVVFKTVKLFTGENIYTGTCKRAGLIIKAKFLVNPLLKYNRLTLVGKLDGKAFKQYIACQ